ncbi:MAG: tagatose 1,6-diphosphate aldolase [Rhodospirillales bacterium]|nr:tagatose 1,6-diphosphate aldolase [Rhodospirillales bacterium]
MTGLSAGKYWGLRRLAAPGGTFSMLAADQRPPIMAMIRSRTGRAPAFAEIAEVKRMLVGELGLAASAVLIDPVWGLSAALPDLPPRRGLLVTLEDHVYEEGPGGRRSAAIAEWSAEKIRRLGADAVKLLAWFRPDAAEEVVAHQRAFVAAAGDACRQHDIPFVLELLIYPFAAPGEADANDAADPAKRPSLVLDSITPFAVEGVDLWKLESPLPADAIPDPDGPGAAPVQALFDRLGGRVPGPWVMLSGGAEFAHFRAVLVYAYRAGASGFLAGRSIWADAFQAWPDRAACIQTLRETARPRLERLSELTEKSAQAWHRHPRFGAGVSVADAGAGFASAYGKDPCSARAALTARPEAIA